MGYLLTTYEFVCDDMEKFCKEIYNILLSIYWYYKFYDFSQLCVIINIYSI